METQISDYSTVYGLNRAEYRLYCRVLARYNLSPSQRKGLRGEIRAAFGLKARLRRMFPYPFRCPKVVYDPVRRFMDSAPDISIVLGKLTVLLEVKIWAFKITPDDIQHFIAPKNWQALGKVIRVFLNVQSGQPSQAVKDALKALGIRFANGIDQLLNPLTDVQEESGLCSPTVTSVNVNRIGKISSSVVCGDCDFGVVGWREHTPPQFDYADYLVGLVRAKAVASSYSRRPPFQ